MKIKVKECEKLRTELEVARNETQVETDSQLTVQAQLKNEIKEILTENSEIKRTNKSMEEKIKNLEEKVTAADKEKISHISKLEASKMNHKKELDDQEVMYKEKMKGLESYFETLQAKIDELQKKRISEHETEVKKELIGLETRNEQLEKEKMILLREKNEIAADLQKTQKDLKRISKEKETCADELKALKEKREDTVVVDIEETSKLKKEIEELQSELKNVKLDLRIEKREVEKKSSLLTYVREKEQKNREKVEEFDKEKSKLEAEIQKLKTEVDSFTADKASMEAKDEKFKKQNEDLRKIKDEKAEMSIEIRKLKTDSSVVETRLESYKKKIENLEKENEKCESLKINNEALLALSKELDDQVTDFESIKDKLENRIQKIEEEKRELDSKLDKEREETRKAKVAVNEEKSHKILSESKIKDLKSRLEEAEKQHAEASKSHEKHLGEYKALCKKLSDTLEDLTKDNANKEQFGKLNERAKSILEVENKQLKEELTEKITQLHSHKESNFKLNQVVEEAIEKIKTKNQEIDDLQIKMETESRMAKEKGLRLESTQAQQSKLIDFLQTKVANLEGRKKTFADKIFGNKENRPAGSSMHVAYGDLEGLLEKEKAKSKKLTAQLERARAEVVSLKSNPELGTLPRKVLQQLDTSSGTTSHNIPHRLVTITNKKSVKCPVCQDSISLLTAASACKDCGIIVHLQCSSALPNNCGLSSQLASIKSVQPPSTPISSRPLPPAPATPDLLKEGKVQSLVGGQWADVFLVLRSGVLDMFSDQEKSNKLDQLGLTLPHCTVSLQSSVSFAEVMLSGTSFCLTSCNAQVYHINYTDRPYTFKLSVHTVGKLEKALYFMCQNFSSKVDWVNRLEEVIKSSPSNLSPVKTESTVTRAVVASLPPPDEVLAVVRVEDVLVLGTTQGLATVRDGKVVSVEGLQTPVHILQHIPSLHLLLLATGGDDLPGQLLTLDTRPVLSGSGRVEPRPVPDITRSHIFSSSENSQVRHETASQLSTRPRVQGKVFLCAANDHLVTILEWSHKRGDFVLRNKFSTDQPTKSIFFTENSVLVGTSKYYEIDLKNFSAEEFLDLCHPGIQKSVSSLEFKESAPHSVMKINDDEFVLAFTR